LWLLYRHIMLEAKTNRKPADFHQEWSIIGFQISKTLQDNHPKHELLCSYWIWRLFSWKFHHWGALACRIQKSYLGFSRGNIWNWIFEIGFQKRIKVRKIQWFRLNYWCTKYLKVTTSCLE
jgi:hypothetical protein